MPLPTSWLNFHLPYRCRHSLACCSSGWPIPIERDRATAVEREVATGQVHPLHDTLAGARRRRTRAKWPGRSSSTCRAMRVPASAGVANRLAGSRAMLSERRRSRRVHHLPHRPLSCAHFPYVCLIDQRGVHVTLSHYCPTAASLLFEHDGPIEIVEGPPPIPGLEVPEGLDARESLPPLARPKGNPKGLPPQLMSFDEFSAWEREQVEGFQGSKGSKVPEF